MELYLLSHQLNLQQRTKLIEIMLIVGAIVAAFKIPNDVLYLFMGFVLASILYYIIIQEETGDITKITLLDKLLMVLLSITVSVSFVVIIMYAFIVGIVSHVEESKYPIVAGLFIAWFFLISIFTIFWALLPPFGFKECSKPV